MTFDDQLERALDTFSGLLREEVARQVRVASDELTAAARAEAVSRDGGPAAARLLDAIRAFDGARSLTDILATLLRCAGQEASRVGVFLVRGDHFTSWRAMGFGASVDGEPIEIADADAGVIAQAARTASVASSAGDNGAAAPAFAQRAAGGDCVAFPLVLYGQVVAVLYADGSPANSEPGTPNPEPGTPNPEPGTPNPEPGTPNPEPGTLNPEPGTLNPEPLEVLCRHAARCLEALTAIKVARSLTVRPAPQPASSDSPGDDLNDDHASARRYARILVSEIKLYHEEEVAAGRRERDLTTRLGGEIARARALYEQRVPPDVRHTSDYVHEELVRTLADGDATLMEAKI